ncbi:hypothetical protein [Pseudomonas sp. R5(2019)]|uniref:hypothetical protein n=1 Tax=Pseudomonas sp. R5(2019) TaxID=2697566 RepID=UPI001411E2DB|nr:hypothetical protein [Pseudomonas sp. R5(2019)]NBA95197.1 hypothetical protein [Pseudomonas sp. R5(2019)]
MKLTLIAVASAVVALSLSTQAGERLAALRGNDELIAPPSSCLAPLVWRMVSGA